MEYYSNVILKNGTSVCLRNATKDDGREVLEVFNLTHGETDYLLSYPDENSFDQMQEAEYLGQKSASPNEIEIAALIDGKIVGTAGIESVGTKYKVKHRAEFGICILNKYWGIGIGRALLDACIECARAAGYVQLELEVVADNSRAISMYKKAGFQEYGRNPKGYNSRSVGYQEIVYMRLELQHKS